MNSSANELIFAGSLQSHATSEQVIECNTRKGRRVAPTTLPHPLSSAGDSLENLIFSLTINRISQNSRNGAIKKLLNCIYLNFFSNFIGCFPFFLTSPNFQISQRMYRFYKKNFFSNIKISNFRFLVNCLWFITVNKHSSKGKEIN